MVLFVVLGKIGLGMLLFAAVDAAAATWTWFALRSVHPNRPQKCDLRDLFPAGITGQVQNFDYVNQNY
jgi:hypothetical protein